jgi:hypothetical protein
LGGTGAPLARLKSNARLTEEEAQMADHITRHPHHLIASDRVEGTAVFNRQGDKLGTIKNFMVDKVSGRAEFAVMQFGGLFGLGTDYYPIPWTMLAYDVDKGGYAVNLSQEQIESAPRYGQIDHVYSRDYDDMVRSYYDKQPGPFI